MDSPSATSVRPALSFDGVTVAFDARHPVLERVDLKIADGEFVSLVGPSGCGKSTALRLMAGLLEPTSGTVERSEESRVALVFQEPNLLPWRTVEENIRLPLELLGVEATEARQRVGESLELISFGPADAVKRPRELSGGMRMRVSLARALVTRPDVLLLDEPFAALDAFTREELWDVLQGLWRERGFTVILVTHDLRESVYLADTVYVVSNRPGRFVHKETIDLPRPRTLESTYDPKFVDYVHKLRDYIVQVRQA